MTDLEQNFLDMLAALRDEKNRQISEYQKQAWKMSQRAYQAEQERDALQKRVDGALQSLSFFCSIADKVEQVKLALYGIPTVLGAIEILKGESDV